MENHTQAGRIVILNGAPRSGKSSIAAAIQERFDGAWMSLGVDAYVHHITPPRYRPGIGLRPGGERPDLESFVATCYAALYESVAAHSRLGLHVVVDVGHHDAYAEPRHTLTDAARRLADLPALLVGVRCPLEVIMERRNRVQAGREHRYVTATAENPVPAPVLAWQQAVHTPGIYDVEVDTSMLSPEACADAIRQRFAEEAPPTALKRLRATSSQEARR